MPFKARKAVFEKLEEIADVASLSKEERKRYENSVNVYRTHLCVLDAAEQEGLEKGMKEGLEKGIKEGLEKGMKKGIEEGLKQGREEERLFNARKMKERGYPLKDIEDITGLSESEIAAL